MRSLIYSFSVSLDGYIAGPDGSFDWGAPDEELHQFHNDRVRKVGAELCGRRLYEVMLPWERDELRDTDVERDFTEVWQALPKIVFSRTLTSVEGNARLATGDVAEEVARLKAEPGKDLAVGGAELAAQCIELGLVDEYQVFMYPVIVGGGKPFLPPLDERIDLELVETQTFASRVVYLHYRRAGAED